MKKLKKAINYFGCIFAIFFITFNFNVFSVAAIEKQDDRLVEKISRDYTKKFCNGVAFGLARESAMKFALKENNLIFKSKKGIENLNQDLLSYEIANSVADSCGSRIGLLNQEEIKKYEIDYISMKKTFQEVN